MSTEPARSDLEHLGAVRALRWLHATEQLGRDLAAQGLSALVLRGPHVQRRFLGSAAKYPSADVDLLVRRPDARRARRHLREHGWVFAPNNGRLWRLDGAAAYLRAGVVVDLHWGLHAGLVPARTLRPLAHAMWESASPVTAGLWQPDPETLAAYLIIHTAHQLGRDDKRALLQSVLSVASPEVVHRHLESVGFADLDGPVRGACRGEQPFPKLDPLVVRFAPASRRLIRAARNRLPALIRRQWRARLLPGRGPRRWSR